MKIHELKVLKKYFKAIFEEDKGFEVRYNDRNYKKGDELILKEWDDKKNRYTGK